MKRKRAVTSRGSEPIQTHIASGERGPMQMLLQSLRDSNWSAEIATKHDDHLAGACLDNHAT